MSPATAPSVEFKSGKYVSYVARIAFYCGELETKFSAGEKIQYDGYTAKYNGKPYKATGLQSAVRGNWLVPEGSPIGLGPTNKKNFPTVITSEDDRVVGSAHREKKLLRGVSASEAAALQEEQGKTARTIKVDKNKLEASKAKLIGKIIEGITIKTEVGSSDLNGSESYTTQNQGGREVSRIQHDKKTARAAIPASPVLSQEQIQSDTKKALEKRKQSQEALGERKSRTAKKETSLVTPKGFPANGHWKSRLSWLKLHNENKLLKNIYSVSPDSFKNLMKKEFRSVKFK